MDHVLWTKQWQGSDCGSGREARQMRHKGRSFGEVWCAVIRPLLVTVQRLGLTSVGMEVDMAHPIQVLRVGGRIKLPSSRVIARGAATEVIAPIHKPFRLVARPQTPGSRILVALRLRTFKRKRIRLEQYDPHTIIDRGNEHVFLRMEREETGA